MQQSLGDYDKLGEITDPDLLKNLLLKAEQEAEAEIAAGVRCTGHCCRGFTIRGGLEAVRRNRDEGSDDAAQLLTLLVPIGKHNNTPENGGVPDEAGGEYFTCKHIGGGGDCGIYKDRPYMCHAYPNRETCEYNNCTGPDRKGGPKETARRLGQRMYELECPDLGRLLSGSEIAKALLPTLDE